MKKIYLVLLSIVAVFCSCEEVIDVDLNNGEPRLVVDAALKWEKGTSGNEQMIWLTTTAGYFEEGVPGVSGAIVTVMNPQGTVFIFSESDVPGSYICNNFVPVIGQQYELRIELDNQIFTASETLQAVPDIDTVTQTSEGGFTGDQPEVRVFFTDDATADNFYLVSYVSPARPYPIYSVQEDRLIQGNQSFDTYSDEDLEQGDQIAISLTGISERYYNYLRILLSIAGSGGGSPFQSPPATVRGNIVNTSDTENYALGFFSVSETDSQMIVIE